MRLNKPAKIILIGSALVLALTLAVVLGALNFLSDDGSVNQDAVESLLTWWALFCLVIIFVAAFRAKPLEMILTIASLLFLLHFLV